jgi:8-hydroxy-5-deazaflavin:NADPH oxidoreductase
MRIGFIGAGAVAQTISKHALAVGHRVLLSNTRGPDSLAPLVKELGSGAEAGSPQQATRKSGQTEMTLMQTPWSNAKDIGFS